MMEDPASSVLPGVLTTLLGSLSVPGMPACSVDPLLQNFSSAAFLEHLQPTLPVVRGLASGLLASYDRLDSIVSPAVFSVLEGLGIDMVAIWPITHSLPLVRSPTPVLISIALYLLTVAVGTLMIKSAVSKPRPETRAFKVCVALHNLFLCLLSLGMGVGLVYQAWQLRYHVWGNPVKGTAAEIPMAYLIYVFYVSKIYEFVDTVIMLLKSNLRQVSYLHVYHHASISFIWWIMAYVVPAGDAYFSAAFNSWIHVAMYLYYFLAAVVGKDPARRQKYLFWGKYLTMMQMVQFVSFMVQAVYGLYNPGVYPKGVCKLLFVYSFSLLGFFANFFVRKHGSRPEKVKRV